MRRLFTLVGLGAVLVLVACGEDSPPISSGGGGSGDSLRIEVRAEAEADPDTATLECGEEAGSTGFIDDAAQACRAMRASKQLLIHGPPANVVCTEIYGGPQKARITGTIDGERVDLRVTREDGCAIALWDELEDLIGPPPNA